MARRASCPDVAPPEYPGHDCVWHRAEAVVGPLMVVRQEPALADGTDLFDRFEEVGIEDLADDL